MPHVREALEYLASSYNLYILSNGFRELQEQKMRSAGVEGYFKKIVLSEDIGVHKPFPEIFLFCHVGYTVRATYFFNDWR